MDTANNSTEIVGVLGGLVALAPLIKAIGNWHIEFRKISPKEKTAMPLQPQISNQEDSGRGLCIAMVISSFIGGCVGLFLLIKQSMDSGPVTSGSMAGTVLAVIYIYLGWIKKQPWE